MAAVTKPNRIVMLDTDKAWEAFKQKRSESGFAAAVDSFAIEVIDRTPTVPDGVCHYCMRASDDLVGCLRCDRILCPGCRHGLCGKGTCSQRPQGGGVR